jgi:uncharacterized lipoprotein
MKKILLLTTLIMLSACSNDNEQETQQNCNCDRVVQANTFNIVGTPQNPATVFFTSYVTINDCTGVQRQKTHSTTNSNDIPSVGDCR